MRIFLLALALLTLAGCPESDPGPAVPSYDFERVAMPLHCWTSAHVYGMYDLGDEIAISYRPNRHDNVDVSMAFLTLISPDEGRSFVRPVGSQDPPSGEHYRGPLEASTGWFRLPNGSSVSLRGIAGVTRLPGPEDSYGDLDWMLFLGEDGEAVDVLGAAEQLPMGNGDTSRRVWRHDGVTLAEAGIWLYASLDEAQWEVVGWVAWSDAYPGTAGNRLVTLDGSREAVIASDSLTNEHLLVRPGQPPELLGTGRTVASPVVAPSIGLAAGKLVFVAGKRDASGGGFQQLVVRDLEGGELGRWPWPSDLTDVVAFEGGEDGTIWIHTLYPAFTGDAAAIVMLAPGADAPVRLDLDFEAATFDGVPAALARSDGRLLFSARTKPPSERKGTRDFGSTMFCETGSSVVQGVEPMDVVPLGEAPVAGEMVRVARVGAGTSVGDRFQMTPAGAVWATYHGQLRDGPPDQPPVTLDAPAIGDLPPLEGYAPGAIFDFTDTMFTTTMSLPSNLLDPPRTQELQMNLADPSVSQRVALAFGDEQVYDVQETMGARLYATDEGTFLEADMGIEDPDDRREWGGSLIVGRRHGYTVDDGYTYARGIRAQATPVYVARFDPTSGRVPDVKACRDNPALAYCIALEDVDVVAARVNDVGDLYAIDFRHGRVVFLPHDASEFQIVADGLLSPSDLRITHRGGAEVVLVYDGDILAFTPTPGVVARRSFENRRASSVDIAHHDYRGCADPSTPCVDLVSLGAGLSAENLCVPGQGFGEAGEARIDGAAVASSWSDTEVCLDAGAVPARDTMVQLVRSDGAHARPVAFHAPRGLTGFDVPARVTPSTPVRASGFNLQDGHGVSLSSGMLSFASDVELEFLVPQSTSVSVALNGIWYVQAVEVVPEVVRSCVAGPGEPCDLVVLGLPPTPGTVTIGGVPADVLTWQRQELSVAWPDGLAPGEHQLVIQVPEGETLATVTLLERSVDVLVAGATIETALTRLIPRPVKTPLGWVGGARAFQQYIRRSVLVGLGDDGPFQKDLLGVAGAASIHVATDGVESYVVGNDSVGITITRLLPGTGEEAVETQVLGKLTSLDGSSDGFVAGAGFIAGELVLAIKTPFEVKIARVDLDTLTATQIANVSGSYGWENIGENVSHGAWITPEGVFLANCYEPEQLGMAVVPLSKDGSDQWVVGSIVGFGQGFAPLACAATGEGFAWVERRYDEYRLHSYSIAEGGFGELEVVLPQTLPGVSLDPEEHGILDLQATADGWALLLADRGESPGLQIASWDRATDTWSLSEKFGNTTRVEPGEVCVGPVAANRCEEGLGNFGCAPLACPILTSGRQYRTSNVAGPGYLTWDLDRFRAFYQVANRARTPGFLGGIEVQHTPVLP